MGLTSDYTGLDIHRFRGVIQTAPIVDEHLRLHGATLAVGFGLGNGFLRSWVGVAGDWGVPESPRFGYLGTIESCAVGATPQFLGARRGRGASLGWGA